ncbi:amino acid ABC transporter permease [Nocardioides szechwanensis]|uniref:Amino acid ABC transporter membrane protein 1, PAAT family n=1 Tax=Nocardioides szechwanensis TaxID=1005944 RepID=A0A1G9ZFU6_9ACTN|nr:amino acid ABC transporter permease [Nocardioides szechwanensis]GEP33927.1 amino acid ABC transporter permease [Nocardioides szechwanensis]SDN20300.1 amino acid ABC transporter membrane protein 1, PAAT family [Nocardioides szechwanensis]
MHVVWDNREAVALAFGYTLLLFLISGVLSMVLGTFLAALRVGPVAVLRLAGTAYVTVVRNTPLLIVLIFFRIAGPKMGIKFNFVDITIGDVRLNNVFTACVVGLTVYTSAFVCEALRAGINAVPLGQAEAARAIGLPFGGVMRTVVLPQAIRAALPPMASVQIALLKNTTVAGALGVVEAFARMRGLTNDNAPERISLFIAFALIFVVLVEILSLFANRLERRWRIA